MQQQPAGQFINTAGQNGVVLTQQQQPQQQYVVVTTAPQMGSNGHQHYANYKRNASRAMGAMQIAMAVLLIGLNAGSAALYYNNYWVISTGWWATPIYIIAGSFGIAAGSRPNKCLILTTMILSIISCATVVSVVTQGALQIDYTYWGFYYWNETANTAVSVLFIIFGICELVFAIVQSVLCCQVYCRSSPQGTIPRQQAVYINGGFINPQMQSTVIQPMGQSFNMVPMGQNYLVTGQPQGAMVTGQPQGAMATELANGFNEQRDVQPPPYHNKENNNVSM